MAIDREHYKKQLLDPRWQKKRLEILNLDNFTCQLCNCKDKTLHVHHLCYNRGANIWDYPNTQLITLCQSCHEWEHEINLSLVTHEINTLGLTNVEIYTLLAEVIKQITNGNEKIIKEISELLSPEKGIRKQLGILAERRMKAKT